MKLESREKANDSLWVANSYFDKSVVLCNGKAWECVHPTRCTSEKPLMDQMA